MGCDTGPLPLSTRSGRISRERGAEVDGVLRRRQAHKSKLGPTIYVTLAEAVNLPAQLVSSNPHLVIKDTTWIVCRYLLVKGLEVASRDAAAASKTWNGAIPFVKRDTAQAVPLQSKQLRVPQPGVPRYQAGESKLVDLRDQVPADLSHWPAVLQHNHPALPAVHARQAGTSLVASIHMDLLTSDGWLPIYSIPIVLMQIKVTISNLDACVEWSASCTWLTG
ncbi:hypothetical protein DFH07DRAFT_958531 [Mycena maculata]|uniref:Uncharacterized protein n=1 Tax=Mycena maculata TaxID=230809 RepID=A0AAD7NE41_9AGAR|nr:hypothetical protein DFH07DRAFT_958531 [Mycena maculata]